MPIQSTCQRRGCSNPVVTIPSRLKAGKGKYCSTACYYAAGAGPKPAPPGTYRRLQPFTEQQFWAAFWAKVDKTSSPNGCWLWTGRREWSRPSLNYGLVWVGPRQARRIRRVHVIALIKALGRPLRRGYQANHGCDEPLCVRVAPGHVYEGTQQENMRECAERGRSNKARGEAAPNAKLNLVQVTAIKQALRDGETQRSIALRYGVSEATINAIHRGKHWSEA